jgi:acyl-CoA synthetase (AMP-forming)/AMP-acid ligase II
MWGATPVTASVAETVTKRTGVGWLPAYGASELPVITCNPLAGARLDSVGRAVPGVTLRVTSSGEIQARSPSLMAGYLPEDAGSLDGGWYRTGDVGHVSPDGWVHLTGRTKEMIKVKGFQVAPAEIEAVLLADPSVADCGVFGLDDPETGEAIVAAVVPSGPVDPARLQALVADSLASYKRIRRLLIVEEIPRLPSGKLLRRTLKERYGRTLDG